MRKLAETLASRPFLVIFFFVLGVAVATNYLQGKPVILGQVYNLNDPASIQQMSYEYPETAAGAKKEFPQDGSGKAFLYIGTWPDE